MEDKDVKLEIVGRARLLDALAPRDPASCACWPDDSPPMISSARLKRQLALLAAHVKTAPSKREQQRRLARIRSLANHPTPGQVASLLIEFGIIRLVPNLTNKHPIESPAPDANQRKSAEAKRIRDARAAAVKADQQETS